MIKDASFTSVWDNGKHEITSSCKVNMETKEVFDIKIVDIEGLDPGRLTREYVMIDGEEHSVSCTEKKNRSTEYWYS